MVEVPNKYRICFCDCLTANLYSKSNILCILEVCIDRSICSNEFAVSKSEQVCICSCSLNSVVSVAYGESVTLSIYITSKECSIAVLDSDEFIVIIEVRL